MPVDIKDRMLSFINTDDDGFIHHNQMEKNIVKWLEDYIDNVDMDIEMYKLFYKHHLDLFINNEEKFGKIIIKPEFNLEEYAKYRNAYMIIDKYFKNLNSKFIQLYDPKKYETPKESYDKKSKTFPYKSIFREVSGNNFAKVCHKLFIYSYFESEMRMFQYKAKHETITVKGYTGIFGAIFNNYFRRMEKEIEIYCKEEKLEMLVKILKGMITEFMSLGNTPFANITIQLLTRLENCNKEEIDEFLSKTNVRDSNKYTFLRSADVINGAFISGSAVTNKLNSFKLIQEKMLKTKEEIIERNVISSNITEEDVLVYIYLQPNFIIPTPLYKTYKNTLDISCIKKKCTN